MLDERALRTTAFNEGLKVRLVDGQIWSLPSKTTLASDAGYEALFDEVLTAEDEPERRRAELALTLLGLAHNYSLMPEDYEQLLGFESTDPRLTELQQAVRQFVLDGLGRRDGLSNPSARPEPRPSTSGVFGQICQALRFRLLGRIP
jgi:hypothetical protein